MNTVAAKRRAPRTSAEVLDCCRVGEGVSDTEAETLARVFKALGDPARVKLLSLIATSPGEEACVCELLVGIDLSQPTVSHHLKVLHDAGLLEREKRGTWAFYRVNRQALAAVTRVLR